MHQVSFLGFLIVIFAASYGDPDQNIRPVLPPREIRTVKDDNVNEKFPAKLAVSNDGPTILGSKTIFNVVLSSKYKGLIAYQWGSYLPYNWKSLYSNNSMETLVVDWWKSAGSKTCYFIISQMQEPSKHWETVAKNQSTVDVSDKLCINIAIRQNNQLVKDNKLHLGRSIFAANIHDPSHYFKESKIEYTWVFDDGTVPRQTFNNSIQQIFFKEGLFLVQVSASVSKNGKTYSGEKSTYVEVKAKLNGYIFAWRTGNYQPKLPSTEKSFPLGPVNFRFILLDPYKIFANASFSYSWNFGDSTIVSESPRPKHNYSFSGCTKVTLDVYANVRGESYHGVIFKNISIREPIQDLNVKGHPQTKKGIAVQFNITCKGSSPVSFCWYVARGNCKLPSDVMCSPTKLYHNCKNTINHTFHSAGDYCVNVTVTNTVSSAQTTLTVKVSDQDSNVKKHKHSLGLIAAILPIIAGILILVLLYLGIKRTMRFRERRLTKRTEEATFDFRNSQVSLDKHKNRRTKKHFVKLSNICSFSMDCWKICSHDEDIEDEQEMQERRKFLDEDGATTPKRKISYYGTIHRTLGQEQIQNFQIDLKEEDFSPWTPRKNLSKSV